MLRLMIDYGLFLTFGVPAAVSFELPLALGSGKGSESAIATGVLLWTCLFAASVSMLALGSAEAFSLPLNGLYVPGQWIVSGLLLALTSLIIVPEIVSGKSRVIQISGLGKVVLHNCLDRWGNFIGPILGDCWISGGNVRRCRM